MMGVALPAVLAHSHIITVPAMFMSIIGGVLIYGTIISFGMFFQEEAEFQESVGKGGEDDVGADVLGLGTEELEVYGYIGIQADAEIGPFVEERDNDDDKRKLRPICKKDEEHNIAMATMEG